MESVRIERKNECKTGFSTKRAAFCGKPGFFLQKLEKRLAKAQNRDKIRLTAGFGLRPCGRRGGFFMKKLCALICCAVFAAGACGCAGLENAIPESEFLPLQPESGSAGAPAEGDAPSQADPGAAQSTAQSQPMQAHGAYSHNMIVLWQQMDGIWAGSNSFVEFSQRDNSLYFTYFTADGTEKTGSPLKMDRDDNGRYSLLVEFGKEEMLDITLAINEKDVNAALITDCETGEAADYFRSSGFAQDQSLEGLYAQLGGVWLNEAGEYVEFLQSPDAYYYAAGALNGEFRLEGLVENAVHAATGEWMLTIRFEDATNLELTTYTEEVELSVKALADGSTLTMTDLLGDKTLTDYAFAGYSLEEVKNPWQEQTMTAQDALSRYGGIWARQGKTQIEFIYFDPVKDEFTFGQLFADRLHSGVMEEFVDSPARGIFQFVLHCPPVQTATGDRGEMKVPVTVSYGGINPMQLSAAVGINAPMEAYSYLGADYREVGTLEEVKAKLAK